MSVASQPAHLLEQKVACFIAGASPHLPEESPSHDWRERLFLAAVTTGRCNTAEGCAGSGS